MADDRPYHKTPSALDVMRKRAADDAAHNAAVQVVERWNAERSPLWSPTGESIRRKVLGACLHGIAHLLSEPAHGERHGLAFDQPVVEPGRPRRPHLAIEVDVRPVGEHEGRPGVAGAAELTRAGVAERQIANLAHGTAPRIPEPCLLDKSSLQRFDAIGGLYRIGAATARSPATLTAD